MLTEFALCRRGAAGAEVYAIWCCGVWWACATGTGTGTGSGAGSWACEWPLLSVEEEIECEGVKERFGLGWKMPFESVNVEEECWCAAAATTCGM